MNLLEIRRKEWADLQERGITYLDKEPEAGDRVIYNDREILPSLGVVICLSDVPRKRVKEPVYEILWDNGTTGHYYASFFRGPFSIIRVIAEV